MIRFSLILLSLFHFIFPWQEPAGGVTGPNGAVSVSLDTGFNTTGHKYFQSGTLSSCANGTASCQVSTSMNVPTSGDAINVIVFTCTQGSCGTAGTTSNYTASDGTNTYSLVSAASIIPGNGTQGVLEFVACNATAGTYTLTISAAGADTFSFTFVEIVMFKNAHATGCADTNVSNKTSSNTGTAISVTSPGNVSTSGEIAVAGFHCGSGASTSNTGTYTTLDSNGTDSSLVADSVNPTSGATTTAAATCSSSAVSIVGLVSIQP